MTVWALFRWSWGSGWILESLHENESRALRIKNEMLNPADYKVQEFPVE